MAVDKNKLSSNAQKYIQRGQFDKAIREYERIFESDPDDVRALLKIGDLHSRGGKVFDAVDTYRKAAQHYEGKGFLLKAVAVYKKVLDVDPTLLDVHRRLGDVYSKLNLLSEALGQYQLVVGSYERDGRHSESVALLEHMVELAPENETNRLRLAEAHARNCDDEDAVYQFRSALDILRQSQRHADYAKVAERLLYLYPEEVAIGRHLAQAYLATGNTKRALGWLQKLFRADPMDARTLALLGQTFESIGKIDKAIAVFRELARISGQKGDRAKQRQAMEYIIGLDPSDSEARRYLETAGNESKPGESDILATDGSFEANLSSAERIDRCLLDADLLVKYGLIDHARQRLDVARGIDPHHVPTLLKLHELCLASEDNEGASNALVKAATSPNQSNPEQARAWLDSALRYSPGHDGATVALRSIGIGSAASSQPADQSVVDRPTATSTPDMPQASTPPMPPSPQQTDEFEDLSIDLDLNLSDFSLDDVESFADDSSEFELSLDGFELEDLGFDLEADDPVPDPGNDEFGDLLSVEGDLSIDDESEDISIDEFADLLEDPPASIQPSVIIPDPRHSNDGFGESHESTADHSLISLDDGSAEMTAEQAPLDLSDFEDLDFGSASKISMDNDDEEFGGLLVERPVPNRDQDDE